MSNRRHFHDIAPGLFTQVQQEQRTASVIILDLDHFKSINDNSGHDAGDEMLRVVARRLREIQPEASVLARYGGEEFVCLIAPSTLEDALSIAEGMRRSIAKLEIPYEDETLSITASFGVAVTWPEDARVDTAISRADTALYRAKAQGRNRIYSSAPEADDHHRAV